MRLSSHLKIYISKKLIRLSNASLSFKILMSFYILQNHFPIFNKDNEILCSAEFSLCFCFFLCVLILGLCIISNMEDHVIFRCDQLHAFFLQMQVFDIHISRFFRNFLEVDHDRIKQLVRFCLVVNLGKLLLDGPQRNSPPAVPDSNAVLRYDPLR